MVWPLVYCKLTDLIISLHFLMADNHQPLPQEEFEATTGRVDSLYLFNLFHPIV